MGNFQLVTSTSESYILFTLRGYLEQHGGDHVRERFEYFRQAGFTAFIIDFSELELMGSPGLAALLAIAARLVEEDDGDLAAFGFDKQTHTVLEMSSFFFLAQEATSLENAVELLFPQD